MKTRSRFEKHPEVSHEHAKEDAEAAEFHSKRLRQEMKFETRKEASNIPAGNSEYQQMIAEDANFNTKRMVAEAAFFIAERRGFVPGSEVSDWLQAEIDVEDSLLSAQQSHLKDTCAVAVQPPAAMD